MVRPGAKSRRRALMTRRPSLRRRRAADPAPGAESPAPTPAPTAPSSAPGTIVAPSPGELAAASPGGIVAHGAEHPSAVTAVHAPVAAPDPSAPAGLEPLPPDAPGPPSFRDRGQLRRRLRYLRRVRELGFRDLGGLVFDLHRFGREGTPLIAGKLEALATVDVELRALEERLIDRRDFVVLREPGIAACPRCAALHGSDANFCPNCGLRLDGPQAISEVGDAPAAAPAGPLPPAAHAPPGSGSAYAPEAGTPVSSGLAPLAPEPPTTADPPTTAPPATGAEPPTAQPAVESDAEPGRSPDTP